MQQKSAHSQSFHNFFNFDVQFTNFNFAIFVSHIFSSLNPFVLGGTKGHTYLNKLASKKGRFV